MPTAMPLGDRSTTTPSTGARPSPVTRTGLHFTAVHLHRYYRERYGHREGDLPATEWASERVISLPLFPDMQDGDVARVCDAIRAVAAEMAR